MTLLRFICLILLPLPSFGLAQALDANLKPPATQNYEDLRDYGPRGGQAFLSEDRGSGSGDNGPRFREDFEFPFRLEQHVGYHRNAHFGISTKSTDVSYSALSVPRHSRTLEDTFRVTVYVADIEQSEVKADDHVSITISFDGNWKLEGTPLAIDFDGHWAVDDTPIYKLRVTAMLGNTSAQAMLGVLYANGRGGSA